MLNSPDYCVNFSIIFFKFMKAMMYSGTYIMNRLSKFKYFLLCVSIFWRSQSLSRATCCQYGRQYILTKYWRFYIDWIGISSCKLWVVEHFSLSSIDPIHQAIYDKHVRKMKFHWRIISSMSAKRMFTNIYALILGKRYEL